MREKNRNLNLTRTHSLLTHQFTRAEAFLSPQPWHLILDISYGQNKMRFFVGYSSMANIEQCCKAHHGNHEAWNMPRCKIYG